MKRSAFMLALACAVGIVMGVHGDQVLNAQQAPIKTTDLFKMDLAGGKGMKRFSNAWRLPPGVRVGSIITLGKRSYMSWQAL